MQSLCWRGDKGLSSHPAEGKLKNNYGEQQFLSKCSMPCIFTPELFSFCRWNRKVWELVWGYLMTVCFSNSPTMPTGHDPSGWQAWTGLGVFQVVWIGRGWEEAKQTCKWVELPGKETQKQQRQILLVWYFHGLREFSFEGMDMSSVCRPKPILNKFLRLVLQISKQPHCWIVGSVQSKRETSQDIWGSFVCGTWDNLTLNLDVSPRRSILCLS